ncbi:MAG: hypothetical protein HYZ43_09655 [Flavobacteriia bacterium]|nr:hypothetical protein [Flavobacteriia bacterium]
MGRFFGGHKTKPQQEIALQPLNIKQEEILTGRINTNTVLSQIISDEKTIVRLIKQDLLTNVILKKTNRRNLAFDIDSELELNRIIYDLLLLDKAKNKDEAIKYYDKMIEDSCTLLLRYPTMSMEKLALSCYYEVTQLRKWR